METVAKEEIKHEIELNTDVQEEIKLTNAGIICCNMRTETVEGDSTGRLRFCPYCGAFKKIRVEDLYLLELEV